MMLVPAVNYYYYCPPTGPFTKANCNAENVELFVNTLEALVETCLPGDETEEASTYDSLLSVSSNVKLSSSLTSISLASPTEKGMQ